MSEKKKPAGLIAAITAVVLIAAFVGGKKAATVIERNRMLDTMQAVTEERAQQVRDFVSSAEAIVSEYSSAPEITALFEDTGDKKRLEKAQKFTESFSEGIEELEGIYAGDCETCILAHSSDYYVGMITRPLDESRSALFEALASAGDGIYNTGIIRSPASGNIIISMYKAIYDDDGGIAGFTGFGQFAEKLFVHDLPLVKSVRNPYFSVIDVKEGRYSVDGADGGTGKEVTSEKLSALCSELRGSDSPVSGQIKYTKNSEQYAAAYAYIPEYSWLLLLEGSI